MNIFTSSKKKCDGDRHDFRLETLGAATQRSWLGAFSPGGRMLQQTLSPRWEQLNKDAGAPIHGPTDSLI